jgi:hypothetical protein
LEFYNPASPQFPAQYFGKYFFADYCAGWIQLLDPATNGVTGFASGLSFPVDLQVSADGALYYLQLGGGGQLWRVGFSNPRAPATVKSDFDGDGRTDLSIWRGANGNWMVLPSSGGPLQTTPWGASSDSIVPGDFDGDRKTDIAYWQPSDGAWNILKSSNGQFQVTSWGLGSPFNDVPAPGDYDGDGKADIAVWRRSTGTWFAIRSANGSYLIQTHGQNGDTPVPSKLQ